MVKNYSLDNMTLTMVKEDTGSMTKENKAFSKSMNSLKK